VEESEFVDFEVRVVGGGPFCGTIASSHHVMEFVVVFLKGVPRDEECSVIDKGGFEFIGVGGGGDEVGVVEAVENRRGRVALVKAVGYFEGVRFVVIKCEDGFASCHAAFGPLCVLDWDLAASHVVDDSFDDSIGEGAGDVEEKARDNKSLSPFFEDPMDC
jgi:hypothetical protein